MNRSVVPERGLTFLLAAAVLVIAFGVMPWVYGLVAFHGQWARMFKPPVPQHIWLNTVANAIVLMSAIFIGGRLDRKLAGVFTRTLVTHGGLAFLILVTRRWYSIPMLLTGGLASSVLGAGVALIRQQGARQRVGMIGPWHGIARDPALDCVWIEHPGDPVAGFDLIVITGAGDLSAEWLPTLARALLAGRRIRHVSEFTEETQGRADIEIFDLDHLPEGGLTSYRTRKRLLDLVSVVLLSPLAIVIVALASVGILVTMGRPIVFIQTRIGLGGQPFQILKLRTMKPTKGGDGPVAAGPRDPRITPLGQWLRRTRIDELPQLWNVVRGEMSLVGPRPEEQTLAAGYAAQIPAYAFRHLVRPGITGWAQVRGGYAADVAETQVKLAYDLFYLKHFSFSLDLQIMARTVWTLLTGGGAR